MPGKCKQKCANPGCDACARPGKYLCYAHAKHLKYPAIKENLRCMAITLSRNGSSCGLKPPTYREIATINSMKAKNPLLYGDMTDADILAVTKRCKNRTIRGTNYCALHTGIGEATRKVTPKMKANGKTQYCQIQESTDKMRSIFDLRDAVKARAQAQAKAKAKKK
jgi:hypothetical protein